ncbi:MAG TPA: hypothetical protein VH008_25880 [Pseudonocardia sp.]|jgi:hypothetical protein|nr:hypothetical protein [Pseudonocardia sp.]
MTVLDAHLARGSLPVAVDRGRDAVVLSPLLDLPFVETRYDRSVFGHGRRPVYLVPRPEFVEAVARLVEPPALNVIAHVGRCGSTLLANLLGLRPDTLVIKEPGFLRTPDRELLGALLRYCRTAASVAGRSLVVKPTSWTCPAVREAVSPHDTTGLSETAGPRDAEGLRDAAGTRWLLLWREPGAVVRSALATPPPWADAPDARAELARRVSPEPTGAVARYAWHWLDVVKVFPSAPDPEAPGPAVRFLAYPELVADKQVALLAVQAWFRLPGAGVTPAGFEAEAGRYSKAADGTRFEPAGAHRRAELTPADAALVERITGPTLAALRGSDPVYSLLGGAEARRPEPSRSTGRSGHGGCS